MNNTIIINTFNSDNSSMTNIKAKHQHITATITNRFLELKPVIKKLAVTNFTFFMVFIFSKINYFT